jgi:putative tryptophan/tyrosine transport system substrate-binding protein
MRRREFIAALGGAAAWPIAVRAQQAMRRVAVLMGVREADELGQARLDGFLQGFRHLGWIDERNVCIDIRWSDGSLDQTREIAAEFVALRPT